MRRSGKICRLAQSLVHGEEFSASLRHVIFRPCYVACEAPNSVGECFHIGRLYIFTDGYGIHVARELLCKNPRGSKSFFAEAPVHRMEIETAVLQVPHIAATFDWVRS